MHSFRKPVLVVSDVVKLVFWRLSVLFLAVLLIFQYYFGSFFITFKFYLDLVEVFVQARIS